MIRIAEILKDANPGDSFTDGEVTWKYWPWEESNIWLYANTSFNLLNTLHLTKDFCFYGQMEKFECVEKGNFFLYYFTYPNIFIRDRARRLYFFNQKLQMEYQEALKIKTAMEYE